MATKFSQFSDGNILRIDDQVVGLRDGVNTRMNMETGIKDGNDNYLLGWSGVASANNYITFVNAITGEDPTIGVAGVLPDIGLNFETPGAGNFTFLPGTTGEVIIDAATSIQVPSGTTVQRPPIGVAGKFRYNTDTDYLEYWDVGSNAWVIIIAGAAFDDATYVTNTDETADLPNSQPLSALATGIAYVTTTTGIIGTRTLTGTSNQISVSNGTGSAGNPTFAIADNPILPGTGSVQLPDGTTGQRAGAAGSLRYNTTTSLSELTNDGATWTAIATTAGATIPAVILGDMLYGSAVNVLSALAGNTTTTKQYLSQTGTGVVSAAPAWATISGSDVTGAALTKVDDTNVTLTLGGTPATALLRAASITAGWTGQLAVTRGGTGLSSIAQGDLIYGSAANTFSALTKATVGVQYLNNQGTSNNPAWGTISGGDITGDALTVGNDTNVTLTLGGTPATALLRAASITAGWTGALAVTRGGTGVATLTTAYGLLAAGTTATGNVQTLSTGTSGQLLQSGGASALPSWTTATFPGTAGAAGTILRSNGTNWVASTSTFADTYTASNLLYSNGANTVTGLATANSATMFTNSSGVPAWTGSMTNGQLLIGSTGASPALGTLTAGDGVTITNAAASITINATGEVIVNQNSNTVTMVAGRVYIINNGATLVTLTLPTTAAVGDKFQINGQSSGLWKIAQNNGQTIRYGNLSTTTGTGGSLTALVQYDNLQLRCIIANTDFEVIGGTGNLSFV